MSLHPRKTRVTAALAIAAAAALTLSACGTSGPTSGAGSTSGNATAWALTGQQKTIESAFTRWSDESPEQAVDVEFFENDAFKQKIRTAIGSGGSPTLIWSWGGQGVLKTYVEADRVIPLDESVTEDIFPSVVANGTINGTLYAVPNNSVGPVLIYFNKDVLTSAGVDAPPATWDELLDDVATLRSKSIAPFSLGGASKWPQLMWLEYLTDRIGGPTVFDAIQGNEKDAWSHPAIKEALTKIQELEKAGGFVDGYQSVTTDNSADTALLYTGKAAMIMQGAWAYADMKTAAPDFISSGGLGWAPFPTVAGGKGDPDAIVGNASNYWSISADASEDQQKAAAAYLDSENLSDQYVDDLLAGGGVPPVIGLEDKIAKADNADFLQAVYGMARDASSFTLSWDQAIDPGAAEDMLTNLDKIFLGQITPDEFIDAMNSTIE